MADASVRDVTLFRTASPAPMAPRPAFISLTVIDIAKTHAFRRHQHLEHEAIVIHEGAYRCALNGRELRLRRHQALIVKPGDWHEDTLTGPLRYAALRFRLITPALGQETSLFRTGVAPEDQVAELRGASLWPVVERLRAETIAADAIAAQLQDAVTAECVWRLARAVPEAALSGECLRRSDDADDARFLARLNALFQAHVDGRLPVPAMARSLGMSATTLGTRCRRQLRLSPAQALNVFKMERALALLKRTGMSIEEISEHLGFENPYHFSRVFKRVHGKAPSRSRA